MIVYEGSILKGKSQPFGFHNRVCPCFLTANPFYRYHSLNNFYHLKSSELMIKYLTPLSKFIQLKYPCFRCSIASVLSSPHFHSLNYIFRPSLDHLPLPIQLTRCCQSLRVDCRNRCLIHATD